jgi:hypothetical protein
MLTVNRGKHGVGFVVKSRPACLKITVGTPEEVAGVVRHYFAFRPCEADCPVCKQSEAEQKRIDIVLAICRGLRRHIHGGRARMTKSRMGRHTKGD